MYENLLVAVSLGDEAGPEIIRSAQGVAGDKARIDVLYVVDPRYIPFVFDYSFGGGSSEEILESAMIHAREKLTELCRPLGIAEEQIVIELGHPAEVIKELAKQRNRDLIVMGTHGRRGWRRILGSVAGEVLHGTPINVLLCRSALPEVEH